MSPVEPSPSSLAGFSADSTFVLPTANGQHLDSRLPSDAPKRESVCPSDIAISIQRASAASVPGPAVSADLVKCLHIINGEHYSGAERVQDLLAMSMDRFGYSIDFLALKEGKFDQNRRSRCAFHLEKMNRRWDFSIVKRIENRVREFGYQLLHAHTPRTLMVGAKVARRLNLPLVYHVHSPVGRDSTRWLQNWLNLMVEQRSLRHVSKMIAVSNSIGQYMNGLGYGLDRLTVVPNGVPIVSDRDAELAGQDCGFVSPWQFTLGAVALFRQRKGTEVLLQSLAELVRRGCDVGLLAVGGFESPAYEASLKEKAKQLGLMERIHWTGFSTSVNQYFPKMDLFVLPSLFGEGLPMVVLEAMAMGVPVVASRVEGIEQAIRQGVDGEIAIPNDWRDLADRLEKMLASPSLLVAMGDSARRRQRECFSDLSMCQATAQVYDNLLHNRRTLISR